MQHEMPSEWGDAPHDIPELVDRWCAAEVGDEVEPGAAHAGVVEHAELSLVERAVDHRHSGVPPAAADEGVDHCRVVGAVTARLDEHGARQAESFLKIGELVEPGVRRGVRPVCREREAVGRPEHVAMSVAGVRRWREGDRRMRVRVRRGDRPLHRPLF